MIRVDPNDVAEFVRGAHHEMFRTLRREAPLYWHDQAGGGGFWNVTKHKDLSAVSRDPSTFSSERGIILDNRVGTTSSQPPLGGIIMTDPPRHALLRRLVNKGFTSRAVARLEGRVRQVVTEIIDGVTDPSRCDFVHDISQKLPLVVICELMGIPPEHWDTTIEMSNRISPVEDSDYRPALAPEQALETSSRHLQLFMSLVEDRRAEPRDDLLSVLISAEIDGERLDDLDLYRFFLLLVVGGNETTRHATSGGMLALIEHPEQWARLAADRSLLPSAIEEILRWTSPITHFMRVATRNTTLRDQQIRAGDRVVLWYPSANRDEEVFGSDSMEFRIDRDPNDHLAFGIGEHFCIGSSLARLELKCMFEELLARTSQWQLLAPPQRVHSNFIGGIKRMAVTFERREAFAIP